MSVKIDQAFIQAFQNGSFFDADQIAYENQQFNPTAQTAYAELQMIPNDVSSYDLSQNNLTDGVFRIVLNYPYDSGAIAAKQKADAIFSSFSIGSKVNYDGQYAIVITQNRQLGVANEGWYRLVLSIGYQAKLSR